MRCDLCGNSGELFSSIVENSLMNICNKCLRFGKLVERNKNFDVNDVIKRKSVEQQTEFLKQNYNLIIKEYRESLKLTQDELAQKLNEKSSIIQKIENKNFIPNNILIQKIENFFRHSAAPL